MLLRLVARYTRAYTPWIIGVVILQFIASLSVLVLPALNAKIIDDGITQGNTQVIIENGLLMLLATLMQCIAAISAVYCGAKTAMGTGRDLRQAVQRSVAEFSDTEVEKFGSPSLITRATNDVQQVCMLILMTLNMMVAAPLMSISGIVMALREDPGLSWLMWVSVPLLGVVIGIIMARLIPMFSTMQSRVDGINEVMREQVIGLRVIRAFVREAHETQRFRKSNESLAEISIKIGNLFVLLFPIVMMILHIATAAVIWFGAQRIESGDLQVGGMTAFIQYLLQILMAVIMGTFVLMMLPRAIVSARRINDVLTTRSTLAEVAIPANPTISRGVVEFREVSFRYPGAQEPVINNMSFTARPGTTTAIIGPTGAGKSTVIHMIARLMDPTDGEIYLDGIPLHTMGREDIVRRVGVVPQKPYLFSGSVASNLRFGNHQASDQDLWAALEIAQAADFVRDRPEKLDSHISQGGTSVSGGQRQRLCIARALVAAPLVYLFDDSFSALDAATDARLRAALHEKTADKTVIVVAQRISTIMNADQILVVENGKIRSRGTHSELLKNSPTYQEIVESQLSLEGNSAL